MMKYALLLATATAVQWQVDALLASAAPCNGAAATDAQSSSLSESLVSPAGSKEVVPEDGISEEAGVETDPDPTVDCRHIRSHGFSCQT